MNNKYIPSMKRMIYFAIAGICTICPVLNAVAADVKVAFIADQSISRDAQKVLKLIASEKAQLLLIQGDFGYKQQASSTWESQLNAILGKDFPVLGVVGNHENYEWENYKQLLTDRANRIEALTCQGDIGVKALCGFAGLAIVQVAPGIDEVEGVASKDQYPEYITEALGQHDARWRICTWHKNQKAMQIGGKENATGWGVYQACLNVGAMIATGHEHSYSRTYLMSNFKKQTVVHTNSHLELDEGQSFAFVSGLGGKSIRKQRLDGRWWAAKYSRNQQAKPGALFCTFGDTTADCYFKSIRGDIPDQFSLESRVGAPVKSVNGPREQLQQKTISHSDDLPEPRGARLVLRQDLAETPIRWYSSWSGRMMLSGLIATIIGCLWWGYKRIQRK